MTAARARRRLGLDDSVASAARELSRAESAIALLDRARPRNWAEEQARLLACAQRGERPAPHFEYVAPVALTQQRARLSELAVALRGADVEAQLLAERAEELELEAALAEQIGRPQFATLAARRFPLPGDADAAAVRRLAQQLMSWPGPDTTGEPWHVSDDVRDPHSLWSALARLLAERKLTARLQVVPGLVPLAAVAEGVVRIRAGARLSAAVGRRVALHEVLGHLEPRANGQTLGGVFAAGSTRASEDEEGRAVLLEERAGLFDAERRRDLARRYWVAESVRGGADFWQGVELLGQSGASLAAAIELCGRAHRGGGLARESIYLTGYRRVATALSHEPELERFQQSGRLSLAAARALGGSVELDDDGDVV